MAKWEVKVLSKIPLRLQTSDKTVKEGSPSAREENYIVFSYFSKPGWQDIHLQNIMQKIKTNTQVEIRNNKDRVLLKWWK